jgi:hypothetical protein
MADRYPSRLAIAGNSELPAIAGGKALRHENGLVERALALGAAIV